MSGDMSGYSNGEEQELWICAPQKSLTVTTEPVQRTGASPRRNALHRQDSPELRLQRAHVRIIQEDIPEAASTHLKAG